MFTEIAHAATEAVAAEASTGVLGTLGINWKIFIAQLVNFSIVVLVLRQFVYKPLLKAMDKRTKTITLGLEDAKKYETALQELEITKRAAHQKLQTEVAQILKRAEDQAASTKQSLLLEAKQASDRLLAQAQENITQEKVKMIKEIKVEVAALVAQSLEKIIKEKIDPKKDDELIKNSLDKLKPTND